MLTATNMYCDRDVPTVRVRPKHKTVDESTWAVLSICNTDGHLVEFHFHSMAEILEFRARLNAAVLYWVPSASK
jgi:hypothetical protein